jgi:hypothetical protein
MSTMKRYDRPGLLERLTSSTVFSVLFGIAATLLAPVVLLGLTLLPGLVLGNANTELADKALLLLPIGGVIGYVGLFRARRPSTSTADYGTTLVCLAIGIATAATIVGVFVAIGIGVDVDLRGVAASAVLRAAAAIAAAVVVLSLPIVAALGDIARLRRLRAAAEGRVQDSLPLIFLGLAVAEAACAIVIGVQLAAAG